MSWIKEPGEQVKLIRKKLTDLQDKLDRKVRFLYVFSEKFNYLEKSKSFD